MKIAALDFVHAEAERLLQRVTDRPAILGLCGSQGSGKSTLAQALADRIGGTVVLSLDDLYLTLAERRELAQTVHPLLLTRGVPGTHDVALGQAVLDAIVSGQGTALPRFDKSSDDRAPLSEWPVSPIPVRLVIFEGWCVGARPQPFADLLEPLNLLERFEDRSRVWRRYVNAALAGPYQSLFSRIDAQILLAAPNFETVLDWRIEQENELRLRVGGIGAGLMDDLQVARFISHYERLTRFILREMPIRATATVQLDVRRGVGVPPAERKGKRAAGGTNDAAFRRP